MGCASSKQSRCRHCGRDSSSLSRSNSVPLHLPVPVHHPAKYNGDSYHIVALTSSTLGALNLDSPIHNHHDHHHDHISTNGTALNSDKDDNSDNRDKKKKRNNSKEKEFSREIRLAKTWSDMINQKIPKTSVRTPTGEPETINTWELMEGLEDPERSFSFHPKLAQENSGETTPTPTPIPLWLQMSNNNPDPDLNTNSKPIVSDFDPELISTFRKALEEISPTNTSHLRSPEPEKIASPVSNRWSLILSSKAEKVDTNKASFMCPPGGEKKVVLYYTSLRGVRKTYEDCCQVRVIMKGLGVKLDERDVSMDYEFREELKVLLGDGFRGGLPRLFVKGNYIGGIDEIRQLHEDGGLEKFVHGCEKMDDRFGGGLCEACGDIRFVPCERCSGSCKIYYEENEEEEKEEEEAIECGFVRCPNCNENGIVRCPVCCY